MLKRLFLEVLNKPEKQKEAPKEKVFKIKPSFLGSKCERQIFYSATGVPADVAFPEIAKRRMKMGDAISDMLNDVYKESGKLIQYYNPDGSIPIHWKTKKEDREFPISSEDLYIDKGKIDGVFILDGKLYLAEYKSINQNGFSSLRSPKSDHLIQGVTYLFAFNQGLQAGKYSHIKELQTFTKAEGIIFVYVNKDDTDMLDYVVTSAESTFQELVKKIMQIKYYADNNILPPCTPDFGRTCNCNWKIKSKNNQLK